MLYFVYLYACLCIRLCNSDWNLNASSDDSVLGFYTVWYSNFVWVFWRNMLPVSVGTLNSVQVDGEVIGSRRCVNCIAGGKDFGQLVVWKGKRGGSC
jgi:hypothetical protein